MKHFSILATLLLILQVGLWILPLNADSIEPTLDQHNIHFEMVNLQPLLMEHGSLGSIMAITQDQDGFLWIGGEFGLARFDGHRYRIYRRDPQDSTSLCGNYVRNFLVDRGGDIWIATTSGLCRYVTHHDNFQSYGTGSTPEHSLPSNDIAELAIDEDNQLYVGSSKGVSVLSADRSRFIAHYTERDGPVGLTDERVEALLLVDNSLWIGTVRGLNRLDLTTKTMEHFSHRADDPHSLPHNDVRAIARDARGDLWLATLGGGLVRIDSTTGRFTQYTHDSDRNGSISGDTIHVVYRDRSGRIWALTDNSGLSLYRHDSDDFITFRSESQNAFSLTSDKVRTVFEDSRGDLWVGTFEGELQLFSRAAAFIRKYTHFENNPNSLPNKAVLDIQQDSDGIIWVGTENGAASVNPVDNTITQIPFDPSTPGGLRAGAVLSVAPGDNSDIWMGTWSGGLHRYNKATRSFVALSGQKPQADINSPFVWDLLLDTQKRLWIATQTGGLNMLDTRSGEMRFFLHDAEDSKTISWNFVYALAEDASRKELWIATNLGLNRLNLSDLSDPIFTRYLHSPLAPHSITDDRVTCLLILNNGEVWIGTENGGINLYNRSTNSFEHLFADGELPSNNITSMLEDSEGFVWIATPNGVTRVDPIARRHLKTYYKHHGLAGHTFNRDASLLSHDGELYLGSTTGISRISRELQNAPDRLPMPLITEMQVNYVSLSPTENQLLFAPIHRSDFIELQYFQNALYFEFSSMSFRAPLYNQYRYRLKGFDNQWHQTRQPNANYTNLDPGHYIFEVYAADSDGHWSETPAKLEISVMPPPWRSGWAYLGYALLLATGLLLRSRYADLKKKSAEFQVLSTTDALTGTLNRTGLQRALEKRHKINEKWPQISLMLFDIDHFKRINDTRGHDVGDQVLQTFAQIIDRNIRKDDHLVRWGGEEFVLVCYQLSRDTAHAIGEKLRQAVAQYRFEPQGRPLNVTVSIGIAISKPGETFDKLLKRADIALYKAKAGGRNQVDMAEDD